jgi:hypothetical protein
MHKSATKYNETIGKWCKNKHGASKIIDTLETYQPSLQRPISSPLSTCGDFMEEGMVHDRLDCDFPMFPDGASCRGKMCCDNLTLVEIHELSASSVVRAL